MARIRNPGCHPSVTTVTTYHNHRQRVVMAFSGARQTQFIEMNVPHCWLLSETVQASMFVPTCAIG
jgi:hypothetical protein